MPLLIQDPVLTDYPSLHETLISLLEGATSGGGAFAFVTKGGADLYLKDKAFTEFIKDGSFDLLVGIDEVTNDSTLETLNSIKADNNNLSVRAFLHDKNTSLFHPKFCWVRTNNGGKLLIGSGNLTVRGLRNNWEAFTLLELDSEQINSIEHTWNNWRLGSESYIRDIDDPDVVQKAAENVFRYRRDPGVEQERETSEQDSDIDVEHPEDTQPWVFGDENEVLLAEIPRASTRWNQANFNQHSFENFFGSTVWDNSYRILLRHIGDDGTFQEIENRQAVSVASSNWRFELGAASGLNYPNNGRPIGVFIKCDGIRTFLYKLALPNYDFYAEINSFLDSIWAGSSNRMRRVITTVDELKGNCPNLPFFESSLTN